MRLRHKHASRHWKSGSKIVTELHWYCNSDECFWPLKKGLVTKTANSMSFWFPPSLTHSNTLSQREFQWHGYAAECVYVCVDTEKHVHAFSLSVFYTPSWSPVCCFSIKSISELWRTNVRIPRRKRKIPWFGAVYINNALLLKSHIVICWDQSVSTELYRC